MFRGTTAKEMALRIAAHTVAAVVAMSPMPASSLGFVTSTDADVFSENSIYHCNASRTEAVMLNRRAEWQFENFSGEPFGDLSTSVTGLIFEDTIEIGSKFVIEAFGGLSPGHGKYGATITGRDEKTGGDMIMFWSAFGVGYISASPIPAGFEYPVFMAWTSPDQSFYYTSHMYCAFSAPNDGHYLREPKKG